MMLPAGGRREIAAWRLVSKRRKLVIAGLPGVWR
jgi:hypothetical protein